MPASEYPAESERLRYEPLTADHATALDGVLTDPRVYSYLSGTHPTTVAEMAIQFARMAAGPPDDRPNETWWNFAVRRRDGVYIGRIQATLHDQLAEVAYLFGPSFWGQGYAAEAMTWLHERIQTVGRCESCWATVVPKNARSIRLLERLGYREAVLDRPVLLSYDAGDLVYCRS